MSVKLCVYLRKERLITRDDWQRGLDTTGTGLLLHEEFSPEKDSGFVPCIMNGKECGFEYAFLPIEREDLKESGDEIGDRDHLVFFRIVGGRKLDSEAAMLAAAVLTEKADGVFFDPQGLGFANGARVHELIREQKEEERKRGRILAAKDAAITDKHCPKCGAPCPSYRKTCKACGAEVGRAE